MTVASARVSGHAVSSLLPRGRGLLGKRARLWLLVGIAGLAFGLRVSGLSFQSLWRDEVDAIRFASLPVADLAEMAVAPGQNGGLYFAVLRQWLGLAGQSEFALRFFSVFPSVLAVPVAFRLCRRLHPSSALVCLTAAFLMATAPYLVWYGQEGKMYAAVVLVALLSVDSCIAAAIHGGALRWLGFTMTTALACYIHVLAILLVPVHLVAVLLYGARGGSTSRRPLLVSLLLVLTLCAPTLRWGLPMLFESGDTGYAFVPLTRMVGTLFGAFCLGVAQPVTLWTLVPALVLLTSALAIPSRALWTQAYGLLLGWLALPVICLFLITLSRPLFAARYLIYVLPALIFLLARGLSVITTYSRALSGIVLLGLLAINGRGLWLQASTPLKADFRAATEYLTGRLASNDLIVFQIPHGRFSYEYYAGSEGQQAEGASFMYRHRIYVPSVVGGVSLHRWADGLYTNSGMRPEEVDLRMDELTRGSRTVWLVASEAEMWDARGLVRAWLEENSTTSMVVSFTGVAVHRYELP